jgi:hypothetical protein
MAILRFHISPSEPCISAIFKPKHSKFWILIENYITTNSTYFLIKYQSALELGPSSGNEENGESIDWMDEGELNLNGISMPQDEEIHAFPIYSMKEHFK